MTFAQGKLRFYLLILSEKTPAFMLEMKRILSENQRTTAFRPWGSIFLIIFLDQVTKAVFGTSCNPGIAFGLLQSFGAFNIFVPIIAVSVCIYFLIRQERGIIVFALALIIGGGIANITDRLILGCARDFVDLKFWPSFNLADSAISVGVILIVVKLYKDMYSNDLNH